MVLRASVLNTAVLSHDTPTRALKPCPAPLPLPAPPPACPSPCLAAFPLPTAPLLQLTGPRVEAEPAAAAAAAVFANGAAMELERPPAVTGMEVEARPGPLPAPAARPPGGVEVVPRSVTPALALRPLALRGVCGAAVCVAGSGRR